MRPIEEVTREASKASSSAALIIPIVTMLRSHLTTNAADHGVKSMKRDMLASLEKRYENLYTCPHYVICMLLDARFKNVFFTDKESAHEILEEAYTRFAPVTESKSPLQKRQRSDTTPEHGFWDYIAAKSGVEKADTSVDAPTEISAYLGKKPMPKDTDPLMYWKDDADTFPVLAQIARVYLSVQCTSVPSERLFSSAGLVISNRRSRLTPTNAEKGIFLQGNSMS